MRVRMRARASALLPSSFCRSDPEAALRGFANTRSPASTWAALSFSNASVVKNTSPRTSTSGGGESVSSFRGIDEMRRTFSVTSSPTTPSPRVAADTSTPFSYRRLRARPSILSSHR